jgi:uncharacterized membrane protein YhaH (DUF805 family)
MAANPWQKNPAPPVSFGQAIRYGLGGSFRWNGRATLAEYWWWVLFLVLCSIMFYPIQMLLVVIGLSPTGAAATWLVNLLLLTPTLAVGVRRMRDSGHASMWAYAPQLAFLLAAFLMTLSLALPQEPGHGGGSSPVMAIGVTVALASAVAGLISFAFTLTESVAEGTRWDDGYRPAVRAAEQS